MILWNLSKLIQNIILNLGLKNNFISVNINSMIYLIIFFLSNLTADYCLCTPCSFDDIFIINLFIKNKIFTTITRYTIAFIT